jgi:hypothetical protein
MDCLTFQAPFPEHFPVYFLMLGFPRQAMADVQNAMLPLLSTDSHRMILPGPPVPPRPSQETPREGATAAVATLATVTDSSLTKPFPQSRTGMWRVWPGSSTPSIRASSSPGPISILLRAGLAFNNFQNHLSRGVPRRSADTAHANNATPRRHRNGGLVLSRPARFAMYAG